MKPHTLLTLLGLGTAVLFLPGCYIYSYYPETDTYVTTVETKKFVNRNYSRERHMEANNSDCYACHNSRRVMTPYHQGAPGGIQPQPMHGSTGLPAGHPPLGQQQAMQQPMQQWGGTPQAIPGMPGFYSGATIPPHVVPMTPMGPAYGAVPPMVGSPQVQVSPQPGQLQQPSAIIPPAVNGNGVQPGNNELSMYQPANGNGQPGQNGNAETPVILGPYR